MGITVAMTTKRKDGTYRLASAEQMMLDNARHRAKVRGVPCTLTLVDIVIPETCPVFDTPLIRSKRLSDNSPTLDCVDGSKGYVPGNVFIISWKANRLKSNATPAELIKVAIYAAKNTVNEEIGEFE